MLQRPSALKKNLSREFVARTQTRPTFPRKLLKQFPSTNNLDPCHECHRNSHTVLFVARPDGAVPGDAIVLTKPLGTQVAVNAFMWWDRAVERWDKVKDLLGETGVRDAYQTAMTSMSRLNRTGSTSPQMLYQV